MRELLFMEPYTRQVLWGGTKLQKRYGYKTEGEHTGEAWVVSATGNGQSVVSEGTWKGQTLGALWIQHRELFGDDGEQEFPLLVKLIDAREDLSIQVHPDDDYAFHHEHGGRGKTECWYIVDCDEEADIIVGHHARSKEELAQMIREHQWTSLLSVHKIKKGDFFFIPAGTVHAIGAGLLIAEVQQSSNLTYRVYDYGRVGADGKPRELHIAKALDVAKRERPETPVGPTEPAHDVPGGRLQPLVACDRFNVSELTVSGLMEENVTPESFVSLLCLEGEGALLCGGESLALAKGQSVFLPAGMGACRLAGKMRLLRTTM